MARKIDTSRFGSAAPKLLPEDLEGDFTVLTISEFDEADVEDEESEGGTRHSAYLCFSETGDKRVWLNKGQAETLVEQLGDDADKWIGQKVPVEKHVAKFKGRDYPKVRVMPSEEWDNAFRESGIRRQRPATARPVAAGGKKK